MPYFSWGAGDTPSRTRVSMLQRLHHRVWEGAHIQHSTDRGVPAAHVSQSSRIFWAMHHAHLSHGFGDGVPHAKKCYFIRHRSFLHTLCVIVTMLIYKRWCSRTEVTQFAPRGQISGQESVAVRGSGIYHHTRHCSPEPRRTGEDVCPVRQVALYLWDMGCQDYFYTGTKTSAISNGHTWVAG